MPEPILGEPLVTVSGVSKIFCRDLKRSLWYGLRDSIGDILPPLARKPAPDGTVTLRRDEFWANQDLNFEVRRGECVGLIGHNGAGKTTVLKMLNGLIKPDSGKIEMRGKIGALIALGAGFNPILSGRENIYVNGAVLGFSKREIDNKFDAITEFAEIGKFISAPVQTYSSGMQVRLGFAIAAAMQPDVLLIDEVLAVGDQQFRMKCITRIAELIREGVAVIFVSHSMIDIQRICTRVIVMGGGKIHLDGDPTKGIASYQSLALQRHAQTSEQAAPTKSGVTLISTKLDDTPYASDKPDHELETGDDLTISLTLAVHEPIPQARVRLYLESTTGEILTALTSYNPQAESDLAIGQHTINFHIRSLPLLVGAYGIGLSVHGGAYGIFLPQTRIAALIITGPEVKDSGRTVSGIFKLEAECEVNGQRIESPTTPCA